MAAVIIEIADAVVAALNGATLSQSVEATRFYDPIYKLEQLRAGDLKVAVVPATRTSSILTRGNLYQFEYVIAIGFHVRIGQGQMSVAEIDAACDPYMLLTEEVDDLFRGKALATYPGATCLSTEVRLFDPDWLDDARLFKSFLSLTFKLVR